MLSQISMKQQSCEVQIIKHIHTSILIFHSSWHMVKSSKKGTE